MANKNFDQICKSYWLFISLFFCFSSALPVEALEPQSQQEVGSVVNKYLAAWCAGDGNTMYKLWDAKSRQTVTPDQLSHVLAVDITGDSQDAMKLRQMLGGANQRPRCRIASVVSVKAHPETTEYATADCRVQTTFQSLNGVAFAPLFSEELKRAKATDTQTKRGDATLAVALFALIADKPQEVSTLNNNFRAFTHGQDSKEKQGPYITLYIHQFTLVKEQGQWKISNAVSVSDQQPVEFN